MSRPNVVILAGPSGAGKSTAAPHVLVETLSVEEFVNADTIARGLSEFHAEKVAIQAGRIMLRRLDELAASRTSFAFETTLASRTFAPWLRVRLAEGYAFHLVFLVLSSPEAAIERVRQRVREGGHFVPDDAVRRGDENGLRNFFQLYSPIATTWGLYENSQPPAPRLIASKGEGRPPVIHNEVLWKNMSRYAI